MRGGGEIEGVVLLNGGGFDGPIWFVRAPLATLDESDYLRIGSAVRRILDVSPLRPRNFKECALKWLINLNQPLKGYGSL